MPLQSKEYDEWSREPEEEPFCLLKISFAEAI